MPNPFPAVGRFFKKVGKGLGALGKAIFGYAEKLGVTDEVVQIAIGFVKQAQADYVDNAEKREFVVKMLAARFPQLPESIIRFAVEMAVQAVKGKLDDVI